MRTFFFIPPLNKISGGLIVICRLAEILHQSGREVALVLREKYPLQKDMDAPLIDWADLNLLSSDLWVVPEGWPSALAPGLQAGARNLVYVQNWAYLFSSMPEGVSWKSLDVHFLSVSVPVAHFVYENLGQVSEILRPGLNRELFRPDPAEGNARFFSKGIRQKLKKINVAWMPRKNKAIAIQAMQIFEARGRTSIPVNWVEIHGQNPNQVAEILRMSHVFMGTGFPEGFGLPPLEAMACGAIPVTCAGVGGWDYLRQALAAIPGLENFAGVTPPAYYLKPGRFDEAGLPDGPNAFIVPDADPISLAIALEHTVNLIAAGSPLIGQMLENGQRTAQALSSEKQRERAFVLWDRLASDAG